MLKKKSAPTSVFLVVGVLYFPGNMKSSKKPFLSPRSDVDGAFVVAAPTVSPGYNGVDIF